MSMTRYLVWILSVGPMVIGADMLSGQDYPNKPLRIVTGGGASEFNGRLIAQGISGPLGQPVIVESRPAPVGGGLLAKATPDGYTALVSGSNVWLAPLTRKASYDPVIDLAPITLIGRTPLILVVTASLPVKSVKELIAYAKARPGELNNSIGGIGGGAHIAGELFKSMTGAHITAVPYSSSSVEVTDLIGGRVQMTFSTPTTLMEHVKLGKLRALAVTTAERSALAPDLPTVAASAGLPGYEWGQSHAMFVPAKTPAAIIKRLNQEVVRFLKTAEAKEQLLNLGLDVVGSSSEQLAATVKSDLARVSKMMKDAGIKVE